MTGQSIHAKHLTRGTGIAPPESSCYGIAHKCMHGCALLINAASRGRNGNQHHQPMKDSLLIEWGYLDSILLQLYKC